MSLNYKFTNIENWEEVCFVEAGPNDMEADEDGKRIDPYLEGLIFMTPIVGMAGIPKDKIEEFYRRVKFYESLFGPMMTKYEKDEETDSIKRIPEPFTLDHIIKFAGLHTNGGGDTWAKFKNRMIENFIRDTDYEAHTYSKALAELS